ncbi:MAG: outer membrane protein transport protein [Bacteroidia bacterium]|nr:outer membrane protein transport protein [Bacteroidia bacterium]
MLKKLLFAIFSICLTFYAYAQNEQDALRYSQNKLFGSARVQGAGGAFGALGADASAVAINPAGIALYRRNEISGSLAVSSYLIDSKYIGSLNTESKTGLNIPQFGMVFTKVQQGFNGDETEDLVSYSFGFAVNRLNDFNQNSIFSGKNTKSSISDFFAEQANGRTFPNSTPFNTYVNDIAGMAWSTYMIDSIGVKKYSSTFVSNKDTTFSIRQSNIQQITGRINEFSFSSGLNISNFLYFGASLLFQNVNYESSNVFKEKVESNSSSSNLYTSSSFTSIVKTQGTGIGGRFGFIVKPVDFFRAGLSYTTPVRLNLKDDYSYGLSSVVGGSNYYYDPKERTDYFDYDLVTPSKLTVSATLMHPKLGFISVDWDQVDYKSARLTASNYEFIQANAAVKSNYTTANNVRVGSELRYKNSRFRAGYAYYGSPYNASSLGISLDNPTQSISGGLGFLFPSVDNYGSDFYIDGAMVYTWNTYYQTPYQLLEKGKTSYAAENQFTMMNFMVTAGLRF